MQQDQQVNGVNKCANCGSSDVSFHAGVLVCGHCRHRWNTAFLADELRLSEGIENLVGTSVLAGAKNIDTSSLVTVECDGCGAAIAINTETSLSATCHWCRHTLSLNNPLDNGAIPDAILPFFITREDAAARMAAYVSTRDTYASDEFRRDFATRPIRAVYLPYLVVDGNVTVRLDGRAWVLRRATGSSEDGGNPQYKTAVHTVMREADVLVDDVAIEARSTRSRLAAAVSTSNIINAIQPFDVVNAVRFNSHYITDSVAIERRDVEVSTAMRDAADVFTTLVRGYVNQTLSEFTSGVRWEHEQTSIKGTRWISVLLPVWLYAFEETTPNGPMMHYIAVNGRTGDTEGSVPIGKAAVTLSAKRWGRRAGAIVAAIFGLPLLITLPALAFGQADGGSIAFSLAITAAIGIGVAVFAFVTSKVVAAIRTSLLVRRQRNPDARLKPEFETKYTPTRLEQSSQYLGEFTHGGGPEIRGRNDHQPHVRAADSRVSFGDLPVDPYAGTDQVADFATQELRGWHLEPDGSPTIGWHPTAPPPGVSSGRGGWSVDIPWLQKR